MKEFPEELAQLKIIICGETGVGKTNILLRYIKDEFLQTSKTTIGIDFHVREQVINDKKVRVQFFDTAGQEKYKSISWTYYKHCNGIILVYDVTDRLKFESLSSWLADIRQYAEKEASILLVGNKIDLEDSRKVTANEGQLFAEANGMYFMEISALTNAENCVNRAIDILLTNAYSKVQQDDHHELLQTMESVKRTSLVINAKKTSIRDPRKCC